MTENDWFGKEVIINGNVKYIGEGEDPAENPYMKVYARALKEVYQPERLSEEDSERNMRQSEPSNERDGVSRND